MQPLIDVKRSTRQDIEVARDLGAVRAEDWDRMVDPDYPFLRHAFLHGMEQHDCLRPHGWTPLHLLARSGGRLTGALPLYLKDNSHGEFVFDWGWAEALQRAGGRYYPKLVSAIPFTPVSGPRVLVAEESQRAALTRCLFARAEEMMSEWRLSSLHCLFPDESAAAAMASTRGGLRREGVQYHWHNAGYRDFADFLEALDSKHRKQLRRERRDVAASGTEIEILPGDAVSDEMWAVFHRFYCSTFERKWGEPRLTVEFFRSLSRSMPGAVVLLLARHRGEYVGGAFAMRGTRTLYGRHWGCSHFVRHLHFELCYYTTIDFCIRHGLERLDAGAQGEHKLARGFTPVRTWSVHWLRDPGFRDAVADFLHREQIAVEDYISELNAHSPYRSGVPQRGSQR
jgi:predicted N-acyltransferase